MDLENLYFQVEAHLDSVNFSCLWKGFKRLKFALYNHEKCFFDGTYIEKDDSFVANTAITYKGESVAIWHVMKEMDSEILASKIIHEMFHGFQNLSNENRFPNEIEALIKYTYTPDNLTLKHLENTLMCQLLKTYDSSDFQHLLHLKKTRFHLFKYEYSYEAAVEQIEGSAHFVEWKALSQISKDKAEKLFESMSQTVLNPTNYIPIRIISYSIGALFFYLLEKTNIVEFEMFASEPIGISLINQYDHFKPLSYTPDTQFITLIKDYTYETSQIIRKAQEKDECVLVGDYPLVGLNVYNARVLDNYIISTFFIMYLDNQTQKTLMGDFVVELNESNNIRKILAI